jgi:hypothetical protein
MIYFMVYIFSSYYKILNQFAILGKSWISLLMESLQKINPNETCKMPPSQMVKWTFRSYDKFYLKQYSFTKWEREVIQFLFPAALKQSNSCLKVFLINELLDNELQLILTLKISCSYLFESKRFSRVLPTSHSKKNTNDSVYMLNCVFAFCNTYHFLCTHIFYPQSSFLNRFSHFPRKIYFRTCRLYLTFNCSIWSSILNKNVATHIGKLFSGYCRTCTSINFCSPLKIWYFYYD